MHIRENVVTVGALRFPVRESGPADGAPIILLHGFPDCFHSFDAQLTELGAAGYRAIAPVMRGYAACAVPEDGDYWLTTLVDDLLGLLDALKLPQVHLVGHDWGAVVGWLAVAAHPQRFATFSSLAIPPLGGMRTAMRRHPVQWRKSWYMGFFQLRGVADWVVARKDFAFIEKLWRDWSPGWAWSPTTMAQVKDTFRQSGVAAAALGYYRHMFRLFAAPNRRARELMVRRIDIPVLVLHGRNDGCMDAAMAADAILPEQFAAGIRFEIIEQAGHFLHQEQSAQVNILLLDFLAGHVLRR